MVGRLAPEGVQSRAYTVTPHRFRGARSEGPKVCHSRPSTDADAGGRRRTDAEMHAVGRTLGVCTHLPPMIAGPRPLLDSLPGGEVPRERAPVESPRHGRGLEAPPGGGLI
jgi:hypothetical protein